MDNHLSEHRRTANRDRPINRTQEEQGDHRLGGLGLFRDPAGNVDVTVGPSTNRSFSVAVRLPTMEQAAAGDVKACVFG